MGAVVQKDEESSNNTYTWHAKKKMKEWVEEGDKWAARVGRRYGVFGYEKRKPGEMDDIPIATGQIAGDVANAVLAYGVTKVSKRI